MSTRLIEPEPSKTEAARTPGSSKAKGKKAKEATPAKARILLATIAAGGSHVSSAQAIGQAVEALFPSHYRLELLDIMKAYGFEAFDNWHKQSWKRALRHPWSAVLAQRLLDSMPGVSVRLHRLVLRDFAQRAAEIIAADPPELIVANHGFLTMALTMSQRRFGLKAPVLTFETSTLNANALWADPEAEHFVVGSHISRKRLERLGVSGRKIDVVGYPIKQAFLHAPHKAEARCQLGLEDLFTCLISLGAEGVGGAPTDIVRALAELPFPVQMVVIAGRNQGLQQELLTLGADVPHLHVKGFVDNMADHVAASDVVIGKTGPASVYETLAVGRPVLAPHRSGGIENKVISFLEAHSFGLFTPQPRVLKRAITDYYRFPEKLEDVARRSAKLNFKGMTERLGRYVAHYAETGKPDLSLCGEGITW
jgi:UDP-N-acetylglucosamine:LPS N-acetylglucosamine transferase